MTILSKLITIGIVVLLMIFAFKVLLPKAIEWKIQKSIKNELGKRKSKPIIEIFNSEGFLIHIPDGKTVIKINWIDVIRVNLIQKDSALTIVMTDGTEKELDNNNYENWINLVKALPSHIQTNNEFSVFKSAYFSNLGCCDICGKIAIKHGTCLSCANDTYEKHYNEFYEIYKNGDTEFENKENYIKRNQLDWFQAFNSNGIIDFTYTDPLYKNCIAWKPSVTASEVIKSSISLNDE